MKNIVVASMLLFLISSVFGQITLDQSMTPEFYVQNVLLGNGVTASNVTINGSAADAAMPFSGLGFFDANMSTFPLDSGLILGTGNVDIAPGPNASTGTSNPNSTDVSSDVDLINLTEGLSLNITSGVVLEFDFIPVGESVSFRYMFASEEYPEFAPPNSNVNDQFGFFLSGTDINGSLTYDTVNIAILPDGTTTVNIANINPATNSEFYQDNESGAAYGDAIQYDGISTILTASADVKCGQTYHIKLALCNVQDTGWDTGVFLEGGSLKSDPLQIDLAGNTVSDTVMTEGCETADIVFQRSICDTIDSLTIFLSLDPNGTAQNIIDFTGYDDTLYIVNGETQTSITIDPFNDDIDEPTESFTITATFYDDNGDTITSTSTFYIEDYEELTLSLNDSTLNCPLDSVRFDATAEFGFGQYTFEWSNNPIYTDSFAYYPGNIEGVTPITLTVSDECNSSETIDVSLTLENLVVAGLEFEQIFGTYPLPVQFTNTSVNATGVEYFFPNGENYTPNNMTEIVTQNFEFGTYTTYLVASNDEGCTDTASVYFEVLELEYEEPNVMTIHPNGNADGKNDFFDINAKNAQSKELIIFNRWGNIVYETTDINGKWDGRDKGGNFVTEGTYFYTYKLTSFLQKEYSGQGFIQVYTDKN